MSSIKAILVLLAFLSVSVLGGCAGSRSKQDTSEMVDSSSITTKVKTKLLTDQRVDGLNIHVDTLNDTVQLSGFVRSQDEKRRAGLLASQISGVKEVVNSLEIIGE